MSNWFTRWICCKSEEKVAPILPTLHQRHQTRLSLSHSEPPDTEMDNVRRVSFADQQPIGTPREEKKWQEKVKEMRAIRNERRDMNHD